MTVVVQDEQSCQRQSLVNCQHSS